MFPSKAGKPTSKPKLATSLSGPPLIKVQKVHFDLSILKKTSEYVVKRISSEIYT